MGSGVRSTPGRRLGVCSWSLRPRSPEELVQSVRECGLSAVQLALDPIRESEEAGGGWALDRTMRVLRDAGITILSGMIGTVGEDYSTLESIRRTGGVRPGEHWEENLRRARACAEIASALGLRLVTFHAGFVPEDHADPEYRMMATRVGAIGDAFGGRGIEVALETGQEPASALAGGFLRASCGTASQPGVNFDPANMILYGSGEPVDALRLLAQWVRQVHIKDALPSHRAGEWGTEEPVGRGGVDWAGFFRVLDAHCPACDLIIEREAGEQRIEDVRAAAGQVRGLTNVIDQSSA